jgi:DNA-binding MarR family transcriptional regulator
MEEEGLVTRTPKRKGRWFTEIKLTGKGVQACDVGVAVAKAMVAETAPVMSMEERQQLHGLLAALRQVFVDSMHLELSPPPDIPSHDPIPVRW